MNLAYKQIHRKGTIRRALVDGFFISIFILVVTLIGVAVGG